ncbi:hypothetical protein Tco_0679492 [Tanacetum coccineum]|uniref:Uncharacterized protein n=1 Tax=Tanacetum coccineum TaxID=301880 RepID=A0ABQ4XIX9_9ASTR
MELHMVNQRNPYAYVVASFQAPPSPDYVPGPEESEKAPPLPEFGPEPVYLEIHCRLIQRRMMKDHEEWTPLNIKPDEDENDDKIKKEIMIIESRPMRIEDE